MIPSVNLNFWYKIIFKYMSIFLVEKTWIKNVRGGDWESVLLLVVGVKNRLFGVISRPGRFEMKYLTIWLKIDPELSTNALSTTKDGMVCAIVGSSENTTSVPSFATGPPLHCAFHKFGSRGRGLLQAILVISCN